MDAAGKIVTGEVSVVIAKACRTSSLMVKGK
jgi:hypothetical protein